MLPAVESRLWALLFWSLPRLPSTGLCGASGGSCQKLSKRKKKTKTTFNTFQKHLLKKHIFASYELQCMSEDITVAGWNKSGHIYVNTGHTNMRAHVWGGSGGIHVRKPGANLLTQHDLAGVEIAFFFPFFFTKRATQSQHSLVLISVLRGVDNTYGHLPCTHPTRQHRSASGCLSQVGGSSGLPGQLCAPLQQLLV